VFKDKRIADGNLLLDLVVHGIHVRLVHAHALLGQGGGVVDWHVMQLGVVRPVFIWVQIKYLTVTTYKHYKTLYQFLKFIF